MNFCVSSAVIEKWIVYAVCYSMLPVPFKPEFGLAEYVNASITLLKKSSELPSIADTIKFFCNWDKLFLIYLKPVNGRCSYAAVKNSF